MEKKYLDKPFLLALIGVLLIAGLLVAGVSAGSISLDVPTTAVNNGDTITIPVIIHDAQDIAGITIDVSNNVSGAVITIDQNSFPLGFGSYFFNSEESNEVQHVVWFNSKGFTVDSREIFSLQVKTSSSDITEVPITITPITIVNSSSGFLTSEYPVVEVDSFPLTGTITGKILYGKSLPKTTMAATVSDTQTTIPTSSADSTASTSISTSSTINTGGKVASSDASSVLTEVVESISSNENEQSTQLPTPVQTSVSSASTTSSVPEKPVSTQSSPLGVFPFMAMGFLGLLMILKKK